MTYCKSASKRQCNSSMTSDAIQIHLLMMLVMMISTQFCIISIFKLPREHIY